MKGMNYSILWPSSPIQNKESWWLNCTYKLCVLSEICKLNCNSFKGFSLRPQSKQANVFSFTFLLHLSQTSFMKNGETLITLQISVSTFSISGVIPSVFVKDSATIKLGILVKLLLQIALLMLFPASNHALITLSCVTKSLNFSKT